VVGDVPAIRGAAAPLAAAGPYIRIMGALHVLAGALYAITILGLLVAWLPLWMGVLLFQAASHAEIAARSGSDSDLTAANQKLKLFFMIIGICTLGSFLLGVMGLALVILGGLLDPSMQPAY
jgi:hypothetical protein